MTLSSLSALNSLVIPKENGTTGAGGFMGAGGVQEVDSDPRGVALREVSYKTNQMCSLFSRCLLKSQVNKANCDTNMSGKGFSFTLKT